MRGPSGRPDGRDLFQINVAHDTSSRGLAPLSLKLNVLNFTPQAALNKPPLSSIPSLSLE